MANADRLPKTPGLHNPQIRTTFACIWYDLSSSVADRYKPTTMLSARFAHWMLPETGDNYKSKQPPMIVAPSFKKQQSEESVYMNSKLQILLPLIVGMISLPCAVEAQITYEQIDYPLDTDTQVFGINDSGDVVGIGANSNSSFVYASRDGTLTDLVPAEGYLSTVVVGINDAGIMVGSVIESDSSRSGFIRDTDGSYTVFSYPDGQSNILPRGVSNNGLVSGYRRFKADNSFAGLFIYDPGTAIFTDIDLGPTTFAIAHGISSKGEVVGNAFFAGNEDPCGNAPVPGFVEYGWLRTKDGDVIFFQINGARTSARGINDSRMIVGQARDPVTGERKGFVIEAPKTSCETLSVGVDDLLQFPGGSGSIGEGITNSGTIVGIFRGADNNAHGFIATPRGRFSRRH